MRRRKITNGHNTEKYSSFWDILGISASALCAIHCLLLPILLPVLVSTGLGIFASEKFEDFTIWGSIGIAFFSVSHGFLKRHRRLYLYMPLAIAAAIVMNKDILGERLEPLVILSGAILIVVTSILNWHLCRSCIVCK